MRTDVKEAIKLFKEYKLDEAQLSFEEILANNPNDLIVLLHLGKIHSRTQNYGVAINYFNLVLEIEPENNEARTGLVLINSILQLTNSFYFENSYTDDDLYNL